MKKLVLTFFATIGLMSLSFGQYVDQALIFSQHNFGSTARSKAMGNAIGAIGGDFSSLSINPAGVAVYIRSELSTTLDIMGMSNTKATYQGQTTDGRNNNFSFRNFGYVFANPVQDAGSGLVAFNFGIGFNKLNNFNQTINVSKTGSPHSRMDVFAQNTNGITSSSLFDENEPYQNGIPWESKLAWENYLIDVANPDVNGVGNEYQSLLYSDELVNQTLRVSKEGFLNEYVFSFGANFNHKLYLGTTVGLQDLYYYQSSTYSEDGNINTTSFGSFDYLNSASTRGFGYNIKFGAIYKPVPGLRLGFAIHTPTFFDFKESFSSIMSSNLKNVSADADGMHKAESPLGDYDYKMDTPTRIIGSIAYQFGKRGMLSFDYENVNYSNIQYRNGRDGYNFSSENSSINTTYQNTSNLRFGGEFKPMDAISLRAGYELFGNPWKTSVADPNSAQNIVQPNSNFNFNTINAGIGYRIDNISFDVSYSRGHKTDYNYIYTSNDPVKYERTLDELVFTLIVKL